MVKINKMLFSLSVVGYLVTGSIQAMAQDYFYRHPANGVKASESASLPNNNNEESQVEEINCYDPNNIGMVGNSSTCDGMLIVDRAMLDSAVDDRSYSIEHEGISYTFGNSEYNVFTGQITNMEELLYHGGYSHTYFNEDISYWDTSNVTTMDRMFFYVSGFTHNIGNWNVSNVTDFRGMFQNSIDFNSPLNNWDVSSATIMWQMFRGASAFNQPLNSWNVSNVTNMKGLFAQATSFNGDIVSWDVSNVSNMDSMFENATSFSQPIGVWDVSNVSSTWMGYMFNNNNTFNEDLSCWNVAHISSTPTSFDRNATSFESANKPQWGTTGCH